MIVAHRPALRTALSLLLVAATLAACGGAGATPTKTLAPVTVRFAFRNNVGNYVALADAFHEKYPHITIQLMGSNTTQGQVQGQAFGTGLSLTLLKMQAIDVFRDTMPDAPSPSLKSDLLPLDEYIAASKGYPRADFLPGLMDALKVEGTQIGVPAGVNPVVAYYDAYRLKSAGGTPPDTNWTLDDFLKIAVATNSQGSGISRDSNYVVGFCSDPMSSDPVVITYLMGGQLVDNLQNPTRPTMNSAANQRAIQWYASLRTEYKVTPDLQLLGQTNGRGVYQAISMGRCGVWLGFYGDMRGKSWGTLWLGDPVMMPLPRSQASFNAASVDGYYVMRYAAHPQEAWLWLMFLAEHEEAAGVQMPPRASQIESAAFANRVTPDLVAVARSLPKTTTVVRIGAPQGLSALVTVYLEAVNKIVRGSADANEALAAAQQSAQLLLSK